MNLSGKFAIILFGLGPIALLLWAIGIPSEAIFLLVVIAAFLIIFFVKSDSK